MGLRELMRIEADPAVETEQVNSLEYLQRIYRDPTQPASVRMRAAIESLPYENPKLSAMAISSMSERDFGVRLDRAIARSDRAKVVRMIELKPDP